VEAQKNVAIIDLWFSSIKLGKLAGESAINAVAKPVDVMLKCGPWANNSARR
jgi:hypothetical protein